MKKYVLTLAIAFASISFCSAQKAFQVQVGPQFGIAVGDFDDTHTVGLGVDLTAEHKFDDNVAGTLATGVIFYGGKKVGNGLKYEAATLIPIRAGARYYLGSNFYTLGELGLGIISGFGSTTAFAYSLGMGYKLNSGSKNLDLGLKYDAYSKSGTIAGLVFKVGFIL